MANNHDELLRTVPFDNYQQDFEEVLRLVDGLSWQTRVDHSLLHPLTRALDMLMADVRSGYANVTDARQLFDISAAIRDIILRVPERPVFEESVPEIDDLRDVLRYYEPLLFEKFGEGYWDFGRILPRLIYQDQSIALRIPPDGTLDSLIDMQRYLFIVWVHVHSLMFRKNLSDREVQPFEDVMIKLLRHTQLIVDAVDEHTDVADAKLQEVLSEVMQVVMDITDLFDGYHTTRNAELKAISASLLNTIKPLRAGKRGSVRRSATAMEVTRLFTTNTIEPVAAPSKPN